MSAYQSIAIAFNRRSFFLTLAVALLASALAVFLVIDIARLQDRKSYIQTTHFVRVWIEEKENWLRRTVVDYADWGTAYANLHLKLDTDWAFTRNNIGQRLVEELGIEYGVAFDGADNEIYSMVGGILRTDAPVSKLPGVKDLIARARELGPDGPEVVSALVADEREPVLIAARIITPGDDKTVTPDGRLPSILLFGDRLTKADMAAIRDRMHLAKLDLLQADATTNPEALFLRTTDGATGFVLNVAAPQPGRDMLQAILPWLGVVLVSLFLFVAFLVRHGLRVAAVGQAAAEALSASHRLLEQQAMYDPVTGLANRMMLARRVKELAARPETRVTVLFLDLDRFKPVNDTHGHEAGDFVLREIGRRLVALTRQGDLCVRLGGDEFVVLVVDQDDTGLERLCQRIIASVSADIGFRDVLLSVGVSIGIADLRRSDIAIEDVLKRADRALYGAKAAGRGRYRWSDDRSGGVSSAA